jgi:hypothetical protein
MKTYRYLAALLAVVGLSACQTLTVPAFNNPGIGELTETPTRSLVIAATQGIFIDARTNLASGRASYIPQLGIIGRESYNFDASDPRFVTEMLIGPLDGGTPAFGGNHWFPRYQELRDEFNVLNATDALLDTEMSPAEKAGIRGFTKTMQALNLLLLVNTRDENGIAVTVNPDPIGEPPPIVSKSETFNEIVRLLDEAQSDLGGAGSSFAFQMPSGFASANTPTTFIEFNRGLRARVDVYMQNYGAALTNLAASFLDTGGSLGTGVYYNYGVGAGEVANALFDQSDVLLVHPSFETDAQLQGGGEPDQRFLDKTLRLGTPVGDQAGVGIFSDLDFTVYSTPSAPVPIIRNEELVLLRAEANLGCTGSAGAITCSGDPSAALTDINLVRQTSGGLDAILEADWLALTDEQRLDELLYNKRYSLVFEGGHRWIDWRRYGKLAELLVGEPAAFTVAERYPFPVQECDARTPPPTQGC